MKGDILSGQDLLILAGSANVPLAAKVAEHLGKDLGNMQNVRFADEERFIQIAECVRDKDTYIVQPTSRPANETWMELYIIIDALKRASAKRITAVVPYYGYSRQDRKNAPRVPITSKLVANLLTTAGADRILTVDLHAQQLQGYFDIPVDQLHAKIVFIERMKQLDLSNMIVVSPDIGGVGRARDFAKWLGLDIAIIDKRRPKPNVSKVMNIVGNVEGKDGVIFDDIIDTGGTLLKAIEALKSKGMKKIYVCATHPVFSNNATEAIEQSGIEKLFVTDSIYIEESRLGSKIEVLSISKLIADAISMIHREESITPLFLE